MSSLNNTQSVLSPNLTSEDKISISEHDIITQLQYSQEYRHSAILDEENESKQNSISSTKQQMKIAENFSGNLQKLSEEGLGDAQQDVQNQAIIGSKYDEQEEMQEQTYDSQSYDDESLNSQKQLEIIETYNQFQKTNFIPETQKLTKKQQIQMLNQFRIDTGNFLKDDKAFIRAGKSVKHKKNVSTAPHQNRADGVTVNQGQSVTENSEKDVQYEEIKSSLAQSSLKESPKINPNKNHPSVIQNPKIQNSPSITKKTQIQNSPLIQEDKKKQTLQSPLTQRNRNLQNNQNRISKSKQEKIIEQSPREQIQKDQRSKTKELAPIVPQNKQFDHLKKKSDLAHLLQAKKRNKETEQKIIQNLFPQKKKHPWSPDNSTQKRNPQMLDPKEQIQNRNLLIAQSLDLSRQINISRDDRRVFSYQKSNSGSNEMPLVSVKDSNFIDKKDFLLTQNLNPFQKRTTSQVKNPQNQFGKQDQEAQLRLRSKWQELDQYQQIKTKVYKHLQNPQTSFIQTYNDLYESSLDQGSKKKKLFIDDSILQSNDSSNFTSNILDTDRFISRKLQQGSLTSGTSGNTKNIIIESNIQYGKGDQLDAVGDEETLEVDFVSSQNQHESFEEQQYRSNLANQNIEYLSYKIDDGRHTVFSEQNPTQKQQNDDEFHYKNKNFQTKIDGLKNLRKSMGVPQVAHLSKISNNNPINKVEMMSHTTTGQTAFSSQQPILSSQNDYHLVEFKQKMKRMNLEIDQAEINLQNKTDFLQQAEKKLNKKMSILQNSNEIKDPRNKLNQEILMKEKSQTNMKYQMLQQRLEIYLKKFKEFESALPRDKEKKLHNPGSFQSQFSQLHTFLARLRVGLEEGCSQIFKTLYQQQSEADQRAERSHRDYTKLYDQLIDFKAKNNLDEYFEKYLNDETRKNTVQLCKEIMKEDSSEWHDQLQTYKEYLNQFQYSDTKTSLQQNWKDLSEIQKGRLTIYSELDEQTVQVLHDADKNPPIPAQVFSAEHIKKLDELFNQGVYSTGKKVVQRLLQMYVKPTCEVGVNTESLKTLTVKYESRIVQQEDLIEKLRTELIQTKNDLNRFQKKNRDLIQSNNVLAEERCLEREEIDKMRELQARRDQIELHLQKQVSVLRESLENEKLAHANTKTQYREIAGQLTQTKTELKEAISFQKAQTLNKSDGLVQKVQLTTKIYALQTMLQKVQEKLKEQNINLIDEKDLKEMQELQNEHIFDQNNTENKQEKDKLNNLQMFTNDNIQYDQQNQPNNNLYTQKDSINSLQQNPTKNQDVNQIKPIIKSPTSKKAPFEEKSPSKRKDTKDDESPQTRNIKFKLEKPTTNSSQNMNEQNSSSKVQESENSIKKSTLQQDSYNEPTIKRKVEEPNPQKTQISTKKTNKVSIQNQTSNLTDEQTVEEKLHGTSTSDENLQSARQPKYAEIHQKSTFIKQKQQIEKPQQKNKKTQDVQKSLDMKQVPGVKRDNNLGNQLQLSSSIGSQKSLIIKKKRAHGDNSPIDITQEDNTIQHDQVSEEALSTNMRANFTSHKKDTEVTILGTKREKKKSPTFVNKSKTQTTSPMQTYRFYNQQEKPLHFNQSCQTQDIAYVHFACNMFLKEIKNLKEEILWRDNEIQFQDLLGKASYIIQRIKTKAAGPNGVSGNGGMSVLHYKGMSPLNLGFLNQEVKEPRDKSWHFDVSNREKKQLAAGGGETQSLSNRNKKSQRNNIRQDLVLSGQSQFFPNKHGPLTPNTNKINSDLPQENFKNQNSKNHFENTLQQQPDIVEKEFGGQDLKNLKKIWLDQNLNKLNEFVLSASETYENRYNTRNKEDQTQGDNTILNNNHEASSLNQESKFSKYRLLTPNEEEKVRKSVIEMLKQNVEQDHRIKSDYDKKRNQNLGKNNLDQKSTQKNNDQEARQSVSTDQKLNQSIYNKN